MKGSAYIKPLEAEMLEWESKLVSMQNILDNWLKVPVWCMRGGACVEVHAWWCMRGGACVVVHAW